MGNLIEIEAISRELETIFVELEVIYFNKPLVQR